MNSDTDCDQIPGPGRPVPAGAGVAEAVGLRVGDQRGALADVMFHDEQTTRAQQRGSSVDDASGNQQTIRGAAVQRQLRVIIAHLGLFGDLRFGYIRRVRDHQIHGAVQFGQHAGIGGIPEHRMISAVHA